LDLVPRVSARPVSEETRPRRVPAASVRAILEAILGRLGIELAAPLYRYLYQQTGIHPTTLLRYHRGRLATAPEPLLLFLRQLEREIVRGHPPALEGRLHRKRAPRKPRARERVRSELVRRLLRELMERLRVPPNMFYRQVGAAVGLHPVTLFRHARGQLTSAPLKLYQHLAEMKQAVESGREVVFTRAKAGTPVVHRDFVIPELQRLIRMQIFPSKRSLLRFVEASLRLKPRSLERAYSSRRRVFLRVEVLEFLRELLARIEYAPEASYSVGDRIHHPVFGVGVVVGKQPPKKLVVQLADGGRMLLREELFELREWDRRAWDETCPVTLPGRA
jgi:hypothetical protein